MKRDLSKPLASTYGDPKPKKKMKKLKKIKPSQLVSPTQHARNAKKYKKDFAKSAKGNPGYGSMMANSLGLDKASSFTASGGFSKASGLRSKKAAPEAKTINKRFSNANDTKKTLKKKKKK